jgi:drug/metabolite transporter (DMT)-like permease
MINSYIASCLASILTGIHIFSIKFLYVYALPNTVYFYIIIALSLLLWTLSRIFIYIACKTLPISIIHIIMNLSIIVSTLCSIIVFHTKVNIGLFLIGILFMLCGVYCVNRSVEI